MAKKKATRKKRVKRLPKEQMHSLSERDPKRPNWSRGGKWLGPPKG